MRLRASVAACSVFIQGCTMLGVAAIGNRSSSIATPNVSNEKKCIERSIGGVSPITSEELLAHWGKPDNSYKDGFGQEIWRYEFGLRWNGLVIGLIIPIPLVIPVGHDYIEFDMENNHVMSAFMKDDSGSNGFMFFEYHFGIRPAGTDERIQLEQFGSIGYQDDVILKQFICLEDHKLIRERTR